MSGSLNTSSVSVGMQFHSTRPAEQSSPVDGSWDQLQPSDGRAKPQRGGGTVSKPGRKVKEARAGSGTRPEHGHQTPQSREKRLWSVETPETVKTKMYLSGHAKYLQKNLKAA